MSLREEIERAIRQDGPIPFSRYMELCLYHPELGYYARHANQFGKAGDFYTASDVHAVFGRLLARQFEEMWRLLGSPPQIDVVELGPGRGLFARDVLDWSEKKFSEFFTALRYVLVEQSPALQAKLRETLSERMDAGKASILKVNSGLSAHEQTDSDRGVAINANSNTLIPIASNVIIFANEFFDALPVEVLSERGELRIDSRNGRLVETWSSASPQVLEYLDRYSVHPETGERVEALLVAQRYMEGVCQSVSRGFVIVIDYGYSRDELLAGRHRGTVLGYRQHSASPNVFEAPGEQDITAHVNFTALAHAAEKNGMQVQKLLTQSQLLMGIGEQNQFADAFAECRLPQERAKVALQLKHLVTPAGMGETFHVLVASKGVDPKAVSRLSGLSFGTSG